MGVLFLFGQYVFRSGNYGLWCGLGVDICQAIINILFFGFRLSFLRLLLLVLVLLLLLLHLKGVCEMYDDAMCTLLRTLDVSNYYVNSSTWLLHNVSELKLYGEGRCWKFWWHGCMFVSWYYEMNLLLKIRLFTITPHYFEGYTIRSFLHLNIQMTVLLWMCKDNRAITGLKLAILKPTVYGLMETLINPNPLNAREAFIVLKPINI